MNKRIVILGGGSAGWLTALFIKSNWPACQISVVEDPATPPIIAGESGSALLNKLYNFLGINFDEWIKATNAMPKLGGKFTNWNGVGTDYVHGLIPDWYKIQYESKFPEFGKNNDFVACAVAEGIKQENIFYNGRLQRINKLPIIKSNDNNSKFNLLSMPMWHFDSRANAEFLKNIGILRGIECIEGKYLESNRLPSGGIESLKLDHNRTIYGDWFIDCSGFSRLLLHKVIGEPVVDLTKYFPARQVVAWWEDTPKIINYTDIEAMKYGWKWEINLNHRSGNGYIFDPDLISVDQAVEEIEKTIGRKIDPVANLKFMPAQLQNSWRENVIAIGLSSGFLEPLESNGLIVVVAQLEHLSEYWSPQSNHNSITQSLFNKEFLCKMTDIRDFLAMHYRGHRRDTEFWLQHANDKSRIPDSLQQRLDMFSEGFLGIDNTPSYGLESYTIVAQALDLVNLPKLKERLLSKRTEIFDDFNHHYRVLSKEIDNICNLCYTTEQWKEIMYGKS